MFFVEAPWRRRKNTSAMISPKSYSFFFTNCPKRLEVRCNKKVTEISLGKKEIRPKRKKIKLAQVRTIESRRKKEREREQRVLHLVVDFTTEDS